MKKTLLLIIVLLLGCQITGLAQKYQPEDLYLRKIITYNKMKNTGIGLTVGGVILTVVGIGILVDEANTEIDNNYNYNYSPNEERILLGVVSTELGIGLTAAGVVLWSIGGSKQAKYSKKLKALTLSLNNEPGKKLCLSYRF